MHGPLNIKSSLDLYHINMFRQRSSGSFLHQVLRLIMFVIFYI